MEYHARYATYPPTTHFKNTIKSNALIERIEELDLYEPLCLYVNAPFRQQLCWCSGCNEINENYYVDGRQYVNFLKREIALYGQVLGGRGRPTSVHFGGCAPKYLLCDDIEEILGAIERQIGLVDETNLTIEIDPRLMRGNEISRLAELGFKRFSLGLQDFDPFVQQAIDRHQSFELVDGCVSECRTSGIDDLAFCLLYGLPMQTEKSFAESIQKAIALSPDRISVFKYVIEDQATDSLKIEGVKARSSVMLRESLVGAATEILLDAGYVHIGFDQFAKSENVLANARRNGRLRLKFDGFSDDASSSMIGFGASAISFVNGVYSQNENSVSRYQASLLADELPIMQGYRRTNRETKIAAVIENLLCNQEADIGSVLNSSQPLEAIRILAILDRMAAEGLINWRDDTVAVVNGAYGLAHDIATAIDPYARHEVEYELAI
ncbi:MAG: radical SAM protein [Pseudomonadota bacterium]